MHTMSEYMSENLNQFGRTQDFHPRIISYETEMMKKIVIKILDVDIINPNVVFYYQVCS